MILSVDEMIELEVRANEDLERLEKELEAGADETSAISPDKAIGRLSRLDSMQMQEVSKDAQRRREKRIYHLRQALERMDAGEYGRCTACGDWIAYTRLEAQPEASLCGKCAG